MANVKDSAEVPLSSLEYQASYAEPIFEGFGRPGAIPMALFRAFRKWDLRLEDISFNNPTNVGETMIAVELFNKRVSFNVGFGYASLFVANPDWSEAESWAQIARAGLEAIQVSAKAEFDKQSVTLTMHLKPQSRSIVDITSNFIRLEPGFISDKNIRAYGFALYTDEGFWVVDSSVLYPEALFVRMNRSFGSDISIEDLAYTIKDDQTKLLELLGLDVS